MHLRRRIGRRVALAAAITLLVSACGKSGPADPAGKGAGGRDAGTEPIAFTDVSRASGITLRNVNGNIDKKPTILESLGQGAAAFDYDKDGDLDLFVCNGATVNGEPAGVDPATELYRHDEPLRFSAVGPAARLRLGGWFQGAYAADYDADGWTDLFLTSFVETRLLRNLGDGRFEDVTASAGAMVPRWSSGAAFFDADGDGDLDLFVARYVKLDLAHPPNGGKPCAYRGLEVACGPHGLEPEADVFLENVGGRYADATEKAGFAAAAPAYGLGAVAFDYDLDGDMDVFVANDSMPNNLWENRNGSFVDVAPIMGCDLSEGGRAQAGMGVDAADADLDGRPDIHLTAFEHDTNTLFQNVTDGRVRGFRNVTGTSGLGPPSFPSLGWGTRIVDFDRDGLPDIVVANGHIYPQVDRASLETSYAQKNQLFRGLGKNERGDVRFAEVHPACAIFAEKASNRGLLCADFDDDGDQDLFIVRLDAPPAFARNDTNARGHWAGVLAAGSGRNRDAIGAVLTIRDSNGVIRRTERTFGGGFYSSSDPRLWVGLGAATIRSASLRWPDGRTVELPPSIQDRYVRVDQESGAVTEWKRP